MTGAAPMIRETVVTTRNADGSAHIAPLGIIAEGGDRGEGGWTLAPFRPSRTLDNLAARGRAVANLTDDVRVFAGCLTGRRDWPVTPARAIDCPALADANGWLELEVVKRTEDAQRPRFLTRVVTTVTNRPFLGFNRAQAAVVEAAILVSRLHLLEAEKIAREIDYLRIAVDKTAGAAEREAWGWLMARVDAEGRRADDSHPPDAAAHVNATIESFDKT